MLTFEAERHVYRWNGVPVPNVTTILKAESRYTFPPEAMEAARQKGQHVHRLVELDASGELEEGTLPAWLRPVLLEWRRFIHQSGFKVMFSERQIYHPLYRYAGTLDLFGHFPDDTAAVIDVKRSFLGGPTIGLQLAAYATALSGDPTTKSLMPRRAQVRRYALRLREDGQFRLQGYTDDGDYSVFLAALTMHKWRLQHE